VVEEVVDGAIVRLPLPPLHGLEMRVRNEPTSKRLFVKRKMTDSEREEGGALLRSGG
jgi:hypothetical protein